MPKILCIKTHTPTPKTSLPTPTLDSRASTHSHLGKVYLVGAGPGAADLITVRGAQILSRADIVFYDALIEPELLAYCNQAKLIEVGKRCGRHSSAQGFINKRLVDAAQKYSTIVRLKGGDPMIFGRAQEELDALQKAGIPVEVVPGISAALAAAAGLQQSLTVRGVSRSVAFCTLAKSEESAECTTPSADTLALYMGRKHAQDFAKKLLKTGKSAATPVVALTGVSTTRQTQTTTTLGSMAIQGFEGQLDNEDAMLILVGDVFEQQLQLALKQSVSAVSRQSMSSV